MMLCNIFAIQTVFCINTTFVKNIRDDELTFALTFYFIKTFGADPFLIILGFFYIGRLIDIC